MISSIIAISIFLLYGCTTTKVDSFFLENAAISNLNYHSMLKNSISEDSKLQPDDTFVITGHRIEEGDGVVIGYREFASGMIPLTDQATFEKLTIYLPLSLWINKKEISLADEGIIAFWSNGASNFPGKSGCFGYASSGKVYISSVTNNEAHIDLNATFDLFSPGGWSGDCGKFSLHRKIALRKMIVSSLTPWDGSIGNHIYDESIRK